MSGLALVSAAALFWIAWALMPGVGVTDPREIFALVSTQRVWVGVSVVVQLVSAALYAPALVGLIGEVDRRHISGVRWAGVLLLIGAMGSAADAVLHLLAFAMTAPGLERQTLVTVMAFMQGPGLVLLAPMILSFFAGGAGLSFAFAARGVVPRWNARLHGAAVAVACIGGALASAGFVPARVVGLAALGLVSAAQIGIGIALWEDRARRHAPATTPYPSAGLTL